MKPRLKFFPAPWYRKNMLNTGTALAPQERRILFVGADANGNPKIVQGNGPLHHFGLTEGKDDQGNIVRMTVSMAIRRIAERAT